MSVLPPEFAARLDETQRIYFERLAKEMREELHPDLVPWMRETQVMGTSLKHPLVFQIPFINPGMANAMYAGKTRDLAEARKNKSWTRYIYLHERPYRLDALLGVADEMTDEEYWTHLGSVWTDSENIGENLNKWRDALKSERPERQNMMDANDYRDYMALPEQVTIYRGCIAEVNEEGLSWTTEKRVAEFFARRFRDDEDEAVVITGWVLKSDIIALLSGRGEYEVVLSPDAEPRNISYEEV